jgi:hypothetical protein
MENPSKNIATFPNTVVDGNVIGTASGSARNFSTAPWTRQRRPGNKIITETAYTLTADDEGMLLRFISSSAITVTLPSESLAEFSINGQCRIVREGTGQITVVAGSGTSLVAGARPKFRVTGSVANLEKYTTSQWLLWGDTIA